MSYYIIVTEQEKGEFIQRVDERLKGGFELVGGPFITTFCPGHGHIHAMPDNFQKAIYLEYNQAMVMK